MNKKAQQSRDDMFIWYISCVVIVFLIVGALYGFGVIGNYNIKGAEGNEITAAAVAVPSENNNVSALTNDSYNSSLEQNSTINQS